MRRANNLLVGIFFYSIANVCSATIVRFDTSLGHIDVNLYDSTVPGTVENFLSYVKEGAYDNTLIHRAHAKFIIQGGFFVLDADNSLSSVELGPEIDNEARYANVRGTIAMAKRDDEPDSATSQWFFNVSDNLSLDNSNGGYTVFGEIIGDDVAVMDGIADLPTFNLERARVYEDGKAAVVAGLAQVPLRNYGAEQLDNNVRPDETHYVRVISVTVLDESADTAADLEPRSRTKNTEVGGGGSASWALFALLGLLLLTRFRRAPGA